jgi:hypothetical protein
MEWVLEKPEKWPKNPKKTLKNGRNCQKINGNPFNANH